MTSGWRGGGVVRFLDFFRCYMRAGGGGGGGDTNLDVPPPILIFHNYIHRICSYIFICDIYRDIYRGRRGSLYPLSVTTTNLLSARGFTALSAIHTELLCHIRYPHGEMAYPLPDVINVWSLSQFHFHA